VGVCVWVWVFVWVCARVCVFLLYRLSFVPPDSQFLLRRWLAQRLVEKTFQNVEIILNVISLYSNYFRHTDSPRQAQYLRAGRSGAIRIFLLEQYSRPAAKHGFPPCTLDTNTKHWVMRSQHLDADLHIVQNSYSRRFVRPDDGR
jgi:hypothetical protein